MSRSASTEAKSVATTSPSAKDGGSWYAGARARVEAKATLEHAEELGRVLEELGERLGSGG